MASTAMIMTSLKTATTGKKIAETTLNKLAILEHVAASASNTKALLSNSQFTNDSIRTLLSFAKVTENNVLTSLTQRTNEYADKISDVSTQEKEIEQMRKGLLERFQKCDEKIRDSKDGRLGLADLQLLEFDALKFVKKVKEYNSVVTTIQQKQESLYDELVPLTEAKVRSDAPKLRF